MKTGVAFLFRGEREETEKAKKLLDEAKIPYEEKEQGPEDGGPILHVLCRTREYYGLEEIETLIRGWKEFQSVSTPDNMYNE
ncbi:MAG: hypothetical protein V1686_01070 [Patescibacteria group bacterium]